MTLSKCPKCPFLFDPAQVPAGSIIACPQCGERFSLDSATAPEPAIGKRDRRAAAARNPSRPSGSNRTAWVAGGIIGCLTLGLCAIIAAALSNRGTGDPRPLTADEIRQTDLNFSFRKPPSPWAADAEAQTALGVNAFAFARLEPDGWIALGVRDYANREPRPDELREKMHDHLGRAFENLPAELTGETVERAGHKATRYPFRAVYKPTGAVCAGRCTVFSVKGVGYWFFAWCPEASAVTLADELTALESGFRILDGRAGWTPKVVPERVVRGKSANYQLRDREGLWQEPKYKQPADEDPKADLVLEGVLKTARESGDAKPQAELVAFVLDGGDEPLAVARRYVKDRYKKRYAETGTGIELTEVTAEADANPGVLRLKLAVGGSGSFRSADKLLVLSAIAVEGKIAAAEASCPWKERAVWEPILMPLTGSLSPGE